MEVQIKRSIKESNFPLTIVTTIKDLEIYKNNTLATTYEQSDKIEYIELYHNYSASVSLNIGLELASNNIVMLCHQDIYFLQEWYNKLQYHINTLNKSNVKWGVLGFAGATNKGEMVGTHSGLGMNNNQILPVQTLDGSILILQKDTYPKLKFDENLKYFHMYDVDICLQSFEHNLSVYCINVPINHISNKSTGGGFQESAKYIKDKWQDKIGLIYSTTGCINYMT